jgi:transcriptional regulator with PAS, ATPase and Fis domain
LRFVRELERGVGDPPARLRGARRALGAESLLLFDFRTSDNPALIACAGPLPPDFDSGETLVVAGTGGERLIALFGGVPAPWQRDFFAYLGEKLLGAVSPPQPQDSPGLPEDLPLPPGMVVGTSIAMRDLLAQLRATARSDLSVLLTGETGTGKELFARLIHESGTHSGGPFVAVNCAAIPAELLEAELFGIASRVATGVDPRPGLFVQANGGTLFLDEIGDMPERLQTKLLRALQEREVLPLGGTAPRKIDARIVAASNRDLRRLVGEGTFRADLYYRLRGLELRLPPLRERSEDLPPLILAFAARAAAKYGKRVHGVSEKALSVLLAYDWPGNVRELESEIERAVLLCPDGGTLQREHLGALERATGEPAASPPPPPAGMDRPELTGSLREQVEALEREAILRALAAAQGNKSKAAEQLGISRNGLGLKMDRLKISNPESS